MLVSAKMPTLIVMEIMLNLWYYRLNNINPSSSWTWGVSPLFLCFLYFSNALQISVKSCTLCVRFVSSYFICLHIIVSGIIGLTSVLDYLLLVYLYTVDFYMLPLYPIILLKSFKSSDLSVWVYTCVCVCIPWDFLYTWQCIEIILPFSFQLRCFIFLY